MPLKFSTITLAAAVAISVLSLTACYEYHGEQEAAEPPPAAQTGPPGGAGRSSALGGAMDAGERTRDRMDAYQQRLLEEAEGTDR
jgi:hypothetical protein